LFLGAPYFHDAYKGWTCCQNKSTDFTTFLNTPGCTVGKHSNIKPVEPEKITGNLKKESSPEEVIEVRPPMQPAMTRPVKDTPLVRMTPTVAASLRQAVANLPPPEANGEESAIKEGESCKNNGCKEVYGGVNSECKHHPGVPVFHEVKKARIFIQMSMCILGHEVLVLLPEEDF
jgi:cysteine/histidine-rich domain-containing protein 1